MARIIALFGGTFDPVHHGHLIVARTIAEQCAFDRITFVPAASPPHKSPAHATAEDRLEMLRLATGEAGLFDICDCELRRAGPSYTLETVMELQRRHGAASEIHLVIGADMLEDLPHWHRCDELLERVRLVVAARAPWSGRMGAIWKQLGASLGPRAVERLGQAVVDTPIVEISSSQIRDRVRAGRDIRFLVPESVRAYISEHGLYAGRR